MMSLKSCLSIGCLSVAIAHSPSFDELEAACAGVAPGRPGRSCRKLLAQDGNAGAERCFSQDRAEVAFHECYRQICEEQGRSCSGEGGQQMCTSDCMKLAVRRFDNLNRLTHWKVYQPSVVQNASFLASSEVPSFADLQFACSGFTPGQRNKDCTTKRLLDTNLKAQTCFEKNPEEAAFLKCCDQFCTIQGKACTGHQGSELCFKECQDNSHAQYGKKKGVAARAQPHARVTQNASFLVSSEVPSFADLQFACAGFTPGQHDEACTTKRLLDTNLKARTCFEKNPSDEAAFQKCCDHFCTVQGKACTGHQGSELCFKECQEKSHSQYFAGTSTTGAPSSTTPIITKASSSSNKASHAALAQHKVALRGRHFTVEPSVHELQEACAHDARESLSEECSAVRKSHTNSKARQCFEMTPYSKKSYQACCTKFCRAQSKFCGGPGGAGTCFGQCVEDSHPLFTDLQVLWNANALHEFDMESPIGKSLMNAKTKPKQKHSLAQQHVKVMKHTRSARENSTHASEMHDEADNSRFRSARSTMA